MKKLKTKLAALLAAGLILPSLTSCGIEIIEKQLDDVVDRPDVPIIPVTDEEGDKPSYTPTVNSVSLNKQNLNMNVGETGTVTATVSVSNGAANTVTWSTNNAHVSITPNGNSCSYRAVSVGNTTITATSTADSTKRAFFVISVVDLNVGGEGFDDSWLDEGFTYSDEFPVGEIEEFVGPGFYEIIEPSTLESNTYWCEVPADDESAASFVVVADGIIYEDYASDLMDAGFEKVFFDDYFYGYEAIDPTNTYTVVSYCGMDEDTYEDAAPTYYQFFKTEDVWEDGTLTTDTEWNLANIGEDSTDYDYEIEEVITRLPFIAMGQYYEINYNDNSWYSIFGVDMPNEVVINDYSYDDSILYDYDTILMDAGFEEFFDEEYQEYYYEGVVDGLLLTVSYYFGSLGNTISVMAEDAPLSAWPSAELAEFVETYIGSKYSIPDYEETEGASFYWSFDEYYISEDSDETIMVAEPVVENVVEEEMFAYGEKLEAAGFETECYPATETSFPTIIATKGKIILTAYIDQIFEEETETYHDEGPLCFQIYGDDTAVEETGVFFNKDEINLTVDGTYEISLLKNEIPETVEITFASSDTNVATVENGVVTGVAVGTCEITLSCSYSGADYTDTMTVKVVEATSFDEVNAGIASYFEENGIEDTLVLPALQCGEFDAYADDEYGCYSIECYDPSISLEDYLSILEDEGYTVDVDEEYLDSYYVYGESDSWIINIYLTESGMIEIDIFVDAPIEPSDTIVFKDYFDSNTDLDGETFDTASGFEITFNKNKGQSSPTFYSSDGGQARCYASNTVVITAPEGMSLTSVDIVCTFKSSGSFVADCGDLSKTDDGYHWHGETDSLTLSVPTGQVRVNSISVEGKTIEDNEPTLEDFRDQVYGYLEDSELLINYNDGFITVSSTQGTIEELFGRILEILDPIGLVESQSPQFDVANTTAYYFNENYTFAIKFSCFNVDPDLNSIDISVEEARV